MSTYAAPIASPRPCAHPPRVLVTGEGADAARAAAVLRAAGVRVVVVTAGVEAVAAAAARRRPDLLVIAGPLADGVPAPALAERIARQEGSCRALVAAAGDRWLRLSCVTAGDAVIACAEVSEGPLRELGGRVRRRRRTRGGAGVSLLTTDGPGRRLAVRLASGLAQGAAAA